MDSVDVQETRSADKLKAEAGSSADETRYFQGEGQLAAPSFLNTNSKYLNSPFFREVYAYAGLRRNGPDVSFTYIIPMVARALGEVTDFAEFMRLIEEEKAKKPEFASWLAERRDTAFRAEDLAGSAAGTLGHTIWEFLTRTGYEIELNMKGVAPTNDIDYIHKRRGNTHDIEHLVTGFGANFAGEAALNWSNIASTSKYFSPKLAHYINFGQSMLVTGQVHQACAHYPAVHSLVMEATQLGIAMGQTLEKPLLMQPWEDMLDWQMSDVISHLGITPGPGQKAWDWSTDAAYG